MKLPAKYLDITPTTKKAVGQKTPVQNETQRSVIGRARKTVKGFKLPPKNTKINECMNQTHSTKYERVKPVKHSSVHFKSDRSVKKEKWIGRIDRKLTKDQDDSRYMPMSTGTAPGSAREEATGTDENEFNTEYTKEREDATAMPDDTDHFPSVVVPVKLKPAKTFKSKSNETAKIIDGKKNRNKKRLTIGCWLLGILFWFVAIILIIVYFVNYAKLDGSLQN